MDQLSINLDSDAKMLYCMEPLRRTLVQAIITALQLPRGSRGLDVGCGLGLQTQMLAQAVGPEGHVTGMDYSKSLLQFACMFARATGLSGRLALLCFFHLFRVLWYGLRTVNESKLYRLFRTVTDLLLGR